MAHKLRGNMLAFGAVNVMHERKELGLLLSVVISECAGLEVDLTWLYAALLGRHLSPQKRKDSPYHPIGFKVFKAVETTAKRLELIHDLAKTFNLDSNLMKDLEDLKAKVNKAFKHRNILAHSLWVINEEYPDALIMLRPHNAPPLAYEKSDFNEAIDVITVASISVHEFENKVLDHIRRNKRTTRKSLPLLDAH
jgi:hypothetical protein